MSSKLNQPAHRRVSGEIFGRVAARAVSSFDDTIFFTGLTRHNGKWWMYYGGSEYYTCLATAATHIVVAPVAP
ncbi:MAG: hypothetical protein ACYCUV_15675 [Phycisphaerae bacterium]|jgi:hypothetical protein